MSSRSPVRGSTWAVALAIAVAGPSAQAACPEPSLPDALALRVDETTLQQLVDVGLGYLPAALDLPPVERRLFGCGFGTSARVGMTDTAIRAEILSHDVTLEDDALRVVAEMDVHVDGEVEAALCDLPTDCELAATARRATLSARVRPAIDACQLRTVIEDVRVQVDAEDVEIELSECVIVASLVDVVLDAFQSIILEVSLPYLERYIEADFPALIEAAQLGVVLPSFSALGVNVQVAPDAVRFDRGSVHVSASAWAEPSGPTAACVSAGARAALEPGPPRALEPALQPGEGARLAASQDFLQQLLDAGWRSGLFCYDLDELGVDLETPLQPIFPGVRLDAQIRAAAAPALELGARDADVLLDIPSVEADVQLELPGDPPARARARTGARVAGRVAVDPASTSVRIEPSGLQIRPTQVELPSRTLPVRREGLEELFDSEVVPLLLGEGGLTVLDAVFAGAPVAVELTEVETEPEVLHAGLRIAPKPEADATPPETAWAPARPGPVGSVLTIETRSTDDLTPAGMMRHRVFVDGIPEETLRSGRRFAVTGLAPGRRRVELRAVDLSDNTGPPVAIEVLVDAAPPEVELARAPRGLIDTGDAELVVEARDDRSPASALDARYELLVWRQGQDAPAVVEEGPAPLGAPLRLRRLPEDRVLAVRVIVEDEAGNAAEALASFAVDTDPSVGCRGTSAGPSWLALLGLSVLFARPRRRARG